MTGQKNNLISIVKKYTNEFKDKVEAKIVVKLNDLCIEEYSPESAGAFYYDGDRLKPSFYACPPNKILLTKGLFEYANSHQSDPNSILTIPDNMYIKYATLHEMYHLALYKLNEFFIPKKYEKAPEQILKVKKTLDEGFACYIALKKSPFLYKDTNEEITLIFKRRYLNMIHDSFYDEDYTGYICVKEIDDKFSEEMLLKLISDRNIIHNLLFETCERIRNEKKNNSRTI